MQDQFESMIQEIHDKLKIREVMTNYCRGVDRMDREILMSCFHTDAIDDHGFVVGGPEVLWNSAHRYHCNAQSAHQHIITNHTCELDGDTAHTETYYMLAAMDAKDYSLTIAGGRYLDRLEKRDGEWRIAVRKCVVEWGGVPTQASVAPELLAMMRENATIARDQSDASYDRPLEVDPVRVGLSFDPLPAGYDPQ